MKIYKIIFILLLLAYGCLEHENPYAPEPNQEIIHEIKPELGEVRDIFINEVDSTVFIATESKGLFIYKINNSLDLEELYSYESWGIGKDIRSIYFANTSQLIYALDRFGHVYHEYLPKLLDDGDEGVDTLSAINCGATSTHATKFSVNENGTLGNPDIFILYKHNAENELYLENSFSELKKVSYNYLFNIENDITFHEYFDAFSQNDTLYYDISDMHLGDNKFYISNLDSNAYTYGLFETNGNILDIDTLQNKVLSIFSYNDYVFAGTKNDGCYITLLNEDSFSNVPHDKLHIAQGATILDVHFDSNKNKLLLSGGDDGVFIYNWTGNDLSVIEDFRLYSGYAFTSRIFENLIFVATKNGLEIFNIGE